MIGLSQVWHAHLINRSMHEIQKGGDAVKLFHEGSWKQMPKGEESTMLGAESR